MKDRYEFEYIGSEPGYCRTEYRRRLLTVEGEEHTALYCIMVPDGAHTLTPEWREPCTPLRTNALSKCFFQRVPKEDIMSQEINAWIEENAAGILPDDHEFTVTQLEK